MYGDHHHESDHIPPAQANGYEAVKKHGLIDDPRFHRPAPPPFNPSWRNEPVTGNETIIVTDGRHFSDTLDSLNMKLGHDYDCWAPVGERLTNAFRAVYGADGTQRPLSRTTECQTAFIAAAGASLREWMDQTQRHTVQNRILYRGLIQDLTWVRTGDMKPSSPR